ncbi:MAG: hypothetical protein NW214_05790 [Pseudanabaenaceae cyanobacterium bins.39]|nr:hypothetical protein [Pseudanabaenaceae cyanobacterium bins.39]
MNAIGSYLVTNLINKNDSLKGETSILINAGHQVSSILMSGLISGLVTFSGFVLPNLMLSSSAHAQTAIMAAIYQNPDMEMSAPTEGSSREQTNQVNPLKLAINNSPTVMAVAEDIMAEPIFDRIITINSSQHFACLFNAQGSENGAIMCGFIDYE